MGNTFSSTILSLVLVFVTSLASSQEAVNLSWETSVPKAMEEAKISGKLVFLHFWNPPCSPCTKLDEQVFSDPGFLAGMSDNFVMDKVNSFEDRQSTIKYNIQAVPSDAIVFPDGKLAAKYISPSSKEVYVGRAILERGRIIKKLLEKRKK